MGYGYDTESQTLVTGKTIAAGATLVVADSAEAMVFYPRKARCKIDCDRLATNLGIITLFFSAIGEADEAGEYPNLPSFQADFDLSHPMLAAQGNPTDIYADGFFDADTYYAVKLIGIKNSGGSDITNFEAKITWKR